MAEVGLVTALKGNLAVAKMTRKEACAKCRACIAGLSEKEMVIEAENTCGAKVGDWVEIELEGDGFLTAVLIAYGLPLVALIAGICLGYFVITPALNIGEMGEVLSFGVGILFTALAYLWIKLNEKRWNTNKYRPKAVKVTEKPEEEMKKEEQP